MVYFIACLLLAVLAYAVFLLQNKEDVDKEIDELAERDESYLLAELSGVNKVVWICALGGFLLTANYAITYMSGSDVRFMMNWGVYEWLGALLGLVVTTAITGVQVVLYASPSHHRAGVLVTFLVICFALFSEIGSPMEKEEMKVAQRSENSATYKAVVSAIKGSVGGSRPSAYSTRLAGAKANKSQHEFELDRCNRHANKGQKRINRCVTYEKKKIAFYQAQIDSYRENMKLESQGNQASQLALVDEAKSLEHNTDKHSGLIKFVKESLATSYLSAMMLASLILIVAFESGFHFAGSRAAVLKAALMKQGNKDIVYRAELKRNRKADHFRSRTASIRKKHEVTRGSNDETVLDNQVDRPSESSEHVENTVSDAEESTVSEQPDTVRVQSNSEHTVSNTEPRSEANTVELRTVKQSSNHDDSVILDKIYQELVQAIRRGELELTARPVKAFVSQRIRGKPIKSIQMMGDQLLARAEQEGVIINNPNYREGNRKPRYLKAA